MDLGITDKVKIDLIPMEKNKVLLRMVNLADLYDDDETTVTKDISVKGIAASLWYAANPSDQEEDFSCKITETSMTGTMSLEEMEARRAKWITQDDKKPQFNKLNVDLDFDGVSAKLEPQRIRTFMLEFSEQFEGLEEDLMEF